MVGADICVLNLEGDEPAIGRSLCRISLHRIHGFTWLSMYRAPTDKPKPTTTITTEPR